MKTKMIQSFILAGLVAVPVMSITSGCAARHYGSSRAYVDDKSLTARVKTELARDPVARATDINVTTWNREVQLSGFVGSEDEKRRAGQITASIPGVVTVHNNLILRTGR